MIDNTKESIVWIKPIKGFEDYLITVNGMIWSTKSKKWLSRWLNDGYWTVALGDYRPQVHVLLVKTFIREYDSNLEECHHINHNRQDCRLQNLQIILKNEHRKDPVTHKKGAQSRRGRKATEQTKRKQSFVHKGHIVTEVTKQKISVANKGRKRTKQAKQKMKDAWKKRKQQDQIII